ncbi:prolipoprotein diacylglyceryl transferase [Thiotrichales bacterium 19S9-12]|nr:prolipoprotein diacylglyceryl transferase [Thiotrichales bacterium 19S9-11]MCF6811810.1 prolipoprotein diacylglyceryl transferase [Thiotrichales bacterium 19S9-12]
MLTYPQVDPVALAIGPVKIHWYGLMYLLGFISAWILGKYRAKKPYSPIQPEHVSDAIFYGALGVIIGGRLGYMLFYDFSNFISNPLIIIRVWDGGMSFHGGLLGVMTALSLFSYRKKLNAFDLLDFFSPMVPIGIFFGRIGNFINGELWGRVTDSPIGMIFPTGGPLPRYPSQLVEAMLEGILLFIILWVLSMKPRQRLIISASFALFYGLFRFLAEFLRQPDPQMGYVLFDWMTMGQVLSLPMILFGIIIIMYRVTSKIKVYTPNARNYLSQLGGA